MTRDEIDRTALESGATWWPTQGDNGTWDFTPTQLQRFAINVKTIEKQCERCQRFFSKYRCNKPEECDCPRCQGMCECAK